MIKLRDYQVELTRRVGGAFVAGKLAPLLVLATGGGKTVVFSWLSDRTAKKGNRVCILVHRVELLRQTSKTLRALGVRHGLIAVGATPDPSAPVQIAMVQTLARRLKKIPPTLKNHPYKFDLIIIDEAHHGPAGTWRYVMKYYESARFLGVSATPIRTDGQGLGKDVGGVFDDLIVGPSTAELIKLGFLTPAAVYAPAAKIDLAGLRVHGGDYDIKELEERVDKASVTGDAVANFKKYANDMPAVAFCASVRHAQHVADQFCAAGFRAAMVSGAMDIAHRTRILKGLTTGDVQIVTSCDIISEGTDIPVIGAVILLRPTASLALYLQQVGRGLRPVYADGFDLSTVEGRIAAMKESGKSEAIVLDHVGNVTKFGLPDEPREWSLEGVVKKSGFVPLPPATTCPKCFAVHIPLPACPRCGFEYAKPDAPAPKPLAEAGEGELRKITEEDREAMKAAKDKEIADAQTLAQLQVLGRKFNFPSSWAELVYNTRKHLQAA